MHILCVILCFFLPSSARNLESSFVARDTNMENTFLSKEPVNNNPLLMKDTYANGPRYMKKADQDAQQCLFTELAQELKTKPQSVAPRFRTDSEILSIWALKNSLKSGNKKIKQDLYHNEGICPKINTKQTSLGHKMPSGRKRFANYPEYLKKQDSGYDGELEKNAYNDIEDMRSIDRDQDYDNDVDMDYERDAGNIRFSGYNDDIDKKIHTFCMEYQRQKEKNECKGKPKNKPKERENEEDRERDLCNETFEDKDNGRDKSVEKDHENDWCNEPYEEKDKGKDSSREKDHERDWCKDPYEEKDQAKCISKEKDWCKDIHEKKNRLENKHEERDKERDWCKHPDKDEDKCKNRYDKDSDEEKARENCETYCKNMERNKDRNREQNRKIKEKQKDRCGDRNRNRERDRCFTGEKVKLTRKRNRDNHQYMNYDNVMNSVNDEHNNKDLNVKRVINKRRTSWQNIFRKSGKTKKGKNKSLLGSAEVSDSLDKTLRLIENYKRLASTIIEYANDIEAALVKHDNDNGFGEGPNKNKNKYSSLKYSPDAVDHLNV